MSTMKVKPYRICDICGKEYDKSSRSAKMKIYQDPYPGELIGTWRRLDICPNCFHRIINNVKKEVFSQPRGGDDK